MWQYKIKLRMGLCFFIIQLCGTQCSNMGAEDLLSDNNLGHVQFQEQLLHPLMLKNQKLLVRQYAVPLILPSNLGKRQENIIQYKNSKKDISAEPLEVITDEQQDNVKAKPAVTAHNVDLANRCPYGGCSFSQNGYGWNGWQYPGSYSYIPRVAPIREPCLGCNRPSTRRGADVSSEVAEEVDLEESIDKPSLRSGAHGRQYRGQHLYPNFRMDSNGDQGKMLDFDYDNEDSVLDRHL